MRAISIPYSCGLCPDSRALHVPPIPGPSPTRGEGSKAAGLLPFPPRSVGERAGGWGVTRQPAPTLFPLNSIHYPRTFSNKKPATIRRWLCAPREIRTPVLALKGPRPGPLDDGGATRRALYHAARRAVKVGAPQGPRTSRERVCPPPSPAPPPRGGKREKRRAGSPSLRAAWGMGGNPSAQVPSPNSLFVDPGGGGLVHQTSGVSIRAHFPRARNHVETAAMSGSCVANERSTSSPPRYCANQASASGTPPC